MAPLEEGCSVNLILGLLQAWVLHALAMHAYSFQTFSVLEVLGAAKMNQIEVNVRDHVHGVSGVAQLVGANASLVLIERKTASTSATLDFTTGIDSTYDEYVFVITGLAPAASDKLVVRYSTDGGANYVTNAANYGSSAVYAIASGATALGDAYPIGNVGYAVAAYGAGGTESYGGVNGELRLFNPSSAAKYKAFTSVCQQVTSTPQAANSFYGGSFITTTAINAIRFYFLSNNTTSGSIALYGVRKA